MSRLQYLPENQLLGHLQDAERFIHEIKAAQRTSGKSGLLGYTSQSANEWDVVFNGSAPMGGDDQGLYYIVEFTGSGRHKWPIIVPYVHIYVNGTAEANRIDVLKSYDDGTGKASMSSFLPYNTDYLENEYKVGWNLQLRWDGTVTIRIKAHTVGTDSGTIALLPQ